MNLQVSTPNRSFNLQLDTATVAAYTTQLHSLVIKLTDESEIQEKGSYFTPCIGEEVTINFENQITFVFVLQNLNLTSEFIDLNFGEGGIEWF